MVAVDSSHLQWVAAAAATCRCPRPPAHHHRSTAESTRTVRVHAATMAVTMRVRHRHRTTCEKRLSFLNFSYVCPEPVLVKSSFIYIYMVFKRRFPAPLLVAMYSVGTMTM
jgi:hypothetical protein